ncbi:surface-adhesin E family protein [Sphingomonas sp. SUN039]|uniref:surface-adhesin E family protein n=1 Tax=Sphingomonas sp. SUN039 TaxID=2937787 RepID=UPI002164BA40|nr:surface-adhesin E family protein [Sphingomonas sp. SUN039]UVO54048.1 hypothetical protein M0209_07900 [Sphingomonas sp. SUN039]
MKRTVLLACLLALCGAQAHAASDPKYPFWPWVQAGRYDPPHAPHMTMWINMETIRRAGDGMIDVWFKYDSDVPDQKGVIQSLVYERLDCRRNWHSTVLLLNYNSARQVVYQSKGKPEDLEPIIPDSLLAGMVPFTCAAGSMPQ